jgi:hypothetical protein
MSIFERVVFFMIILNVVLSAVSGSIDSTCGWLAASIYFYLWVDTKAKLEKRK